MKLGRQLVTIVGNYVTDTRSQTPLVELDCRDEAGDPVYIPIYITPAAANMSKKALKVCGFDMETRSLKELDENPELLKGRQIPVNVFEEEYQGKKSMKAQVILRNSLPKESLERLDEIMRGAVGAAAAPVAATGEIPF